MEKEVKLHINGYEERNKVAAILAENGYYVKIERKKVSALTYEYYVVIQINKKR